VAAGRGRSRRVRIPGVQELLRPVAPEPAGSDERPATGREKHDHKITVYLSSAELLDLEHARLALRRFGLVIDRGRLVREAIAVLLADLDTRGKDSLLARRIGTRAASHPHSGEQAVTNGTVPADGTVLTDGTAPGGTGEPIPSLM
jgi:hypothetical protein